VRPSMVLAIKSLMISLLGAAASLVVVVPASALSCAGTPAGFLSEKDRLVFTGTVLSVSTTGQEMTVAVREVWRGHLNTTSAVIEMPYGSGVDGGNSRMPLGQVLLFALMDPYSMAYPPVHVLFTPTLRSTRSFDLTMPPLPWQPALSRHEQCQAPPTPATSG